jgi:hypothetical protein
MNRHLLHIAFTSIFAAALIAPLSAQQSRGGRAGMMPSERKQGMTADESGPKPQAFSVSLVLGEMQPSGGTDNVPAAARKALADVKDFLPYKAYRLLDSQWTLCCGGSPILTRLRGPEEQDYSLELMPRNAGNGKYSVHFSLWEPRGSETAVVQGAGASGSGGSTASLDAQRAQLEQRLAELRRTLGENHPDVAEAKVKIEALQRALNDVRVRESISRTLSASAARRAIIDTSFTMDVGETVVVGTSRLKGDKALIALLTAVAPAKGSAK